MARDLLGNKANQEPVLEIQLSSEIFFFNQKTCTNVALNS